MASEESTKKVTKKTVKKAVKKTVKKVVKKKAAPKASSAKETEKMIMEPAQQAEANPPEEKIVAVNRETEKTEQPEMPMSLEAMAGQEQPTQVTVMAPTKKRIWLQIVIAAVIAIVGLETILVIKNKVDQQRILQPIKVIGTRGGPPDKDGKYWGPNIIRVDRDRKRVMLVDSGFKKVIFWDTETGSLLKEIREEDTKSENFEPYTAGLDKAGHAYILDKNKGDIFVFDAEFKLINQWKAAYARELAVSQDGNVFVTHSVKNQIDQYSSTGELMGSFGKDELTNPGKMVVDPKGNLYLVELGEKKLKVFSNKGKLKNSFKLKLKPFGLPVPDFVGNKLYVCEHDNHKVQVYSNAGKLIWDIAATYPATIGVDDDGVIYLSGGAGVHQYAVKKKR